MNEKGVAPIIIGAGLVLLLIFAFPLFITGTTALNLLNNPIIVLFIIIIIFAWMNKK